MQAAKMKRNDHHLSKSDRCSKLRRTNQRVQKRSRVCRENDVCGELCVERGDSRSPRLVHSILVTCKKRERFVQIVFDELCPGAVSVDFCRGMERKAEEKREKVWHIQSCHFSLLFKGIISLIGIDKSAQQPQMMPGKSK